MNKKIASEITIGIILLIAIVIGGIFWLQNKNQAPVAAPVTTQSVPVTQTQITQPATQPVVDETANWQTYTNEEYGFEIRIPKDWKNYSVDNISRLDYPGTILALELPTNDPSWLKIGEKKGIVFSVFIVSQTQADEINNKCKQVGSNILCLFNEQKVGQNENYAFYLNSGSNDKSEYPNDFPLNFFSQKDNIIKTFKFTK